MLEMYSLMLVSVGSVWERFSSPTNSKNCQKSMSFLIIHYNRDLNTNGHLLLLLADLSFRDKNIFLVKSIV